MYIHINTCVLPFLQKFPTRPLCHTCCRRTSSYECSVVGTISCGEVVRGNTRADSQASVVLHGYPYIPGNYEGPEVGYTWDGAVSGEVEIGFVDPTPWLYDLDILVLQQQVGVCAAADLIDRALNSVVFVAEAGASYTFVVDGPKRKLSSSDPPARMAVSFAPFSERR